MGAHGGRARWESAVGGRGGRTRWEDAVGGSLTSLISRTQRVPATSAASSTACRCAAPQWAGTAKAHSGKAEPCSRSAVTCKWCSSIAKIWTGEKARLRPRYSTSWVVAVAESSHPSSSLLPATQPLGLERNADALSPMKRRRSSKATTEGVCRFVASLATTSTPPRRVTATTEFALPTSMPSAPEAETVVRQNQLCRSSRILA